MILELEANKPYDFEQGVRDHGWVALAPFHWVNDHASLRRVERLASGKVAVLHLSAVDDGDCVRVCIDAEADGKLSAAERREIQEKVRWMLRLDEDLSGFYEAVASHPKVAQKVSGGRGRLLRSPTLFEDVVKTICTTNTTWSQTKAMVARLVNTAGEAYPGNLELHAFPTPEQVVAIDPATFDKEIRLGYRNAFILRLAREVVDGHRDLETLKSSDLPPRELKRELKQIMGVGDYAAHTLLMILGHYDEIAVDTELRSHVMRTYAAKDVSLGDHEMAAIYEQWGRWKYLVYWFEAS